MSQRSTTAQSIGDFLSRGEAANVLRVSTKTLSAWADDGVGPPFIQVNRVVRYKRQDLLRWIEAKSSPSRKQEG